MDKDGWDDIVSIIREFAGTSLTSKILSGVIMRGYLKQFRKFKVVGSFLFLIQHVCVCDLKCGGIFCKPHQVFECVGLSRSNPTLHSVSPA